MKKYLMMGAAALMFGFVAVSCSNEVYNPDAEQDAITWKYAKAFEKAFGTPDPHHTWGFGSSTRATRANAVITGDPFTFEDTESYYKTGVPSTAKSVNEYVREDWGGKIDENAMQSATELYLPTGTYSLHLWQGERDIYVKDNDNVTLNVTNDNNGDRSINQARIYVLPHATLTLNMDHYINNLEIYVAQYGTLNYNAEKLYNQTGGGKIYSRGTINFTKSNFEANQNSIVYNEGDVVATNITSKPGDGNKSFFYNFGTLTLTGKMELNSCTNFYNGGTVTVADSTKVTQQNIWWINKGHYTTATMVFSAKNNTFYNCCQLFVQKNAHMYDGEFNLMEDSYTEAATADYDNFIVNMYDGAGFNVKGDTDWGPQGDGTYQGFRTMNSGKGYVRLGGTATVAGHKNSLEITGNITYAINKTVDLGAGNSGVQPTIVFNEGTKAANFSKVTMAPKANDCGFTWEDDNDNEVYDGRIMCEDLNATDNSDFDFNDVVFDYKIEGNEAKIKLLAAGGTLPLTVGGVEVHKKFSVGPKDMVNTGAGPTKDPVTFTYTFPSNVSATAINIPIVVTKDGKDIELTAAEGKAASKIHVPTTTKWVREFKEIDKAYDKFKGWVLDENASWVSSIADYELIFYDHIKY